MLYNCFRVAVMLAAIMGTLHMLSEEKYLYIFFPLAIIVWGVYTIFDENDREYLRRNGIDADEISWFFPSYEYYGLVVDENPRKSNTFNDGHHRTYPARSGGYNNTASNYNRYKPKVTEYSNPEYKKLKDKCKRNFKITIEKEEKIENGND